MRDSKAWVATGLICVLAGLAGCSTFGKDKDPDPRDYMSRVKTGMTRADVEDRLGPPDGSWGPWYSVCTEYGFSKWGTDRYAIYYNNQKRVVFTEHAACNPKRAEQLGLRG
jgi:hypothetical protein